MTDDTRTYDRWSDNDFDIHDLLQAATIPRHSRPRAAPAQVA